MDKVTNLLANKIIDYFISNGFVSEDKKSVFIYGTMITIQSAMIIMSTLIIGLVVDMFFENICFFVIFKILRKYSGGLHSEKYSVCFFVSILLNFLIMAILKYFQMNPNYQLIIFLELLSVLFVLLFAPVQNLNKQITKKEYIVYKLITSFFSLALMIYSIILAINSCVIVFSIGMAMFLNCILIILGKIVTFKSCKSL